MENELNAVAPFYPDDFGKILLSAQLQIFADDIKSRHGLHGANENVLRDVVVYFKQLSTSQTLLS